MWTLTKKKQNSGKAYSRDGRRGCDNRDIREILKCDKEAKFDRKYVFGISMHAVWLGVLHFLFSFFEYEFLFQN